MENKFYPILFSSPMVQAIQKDAKTKTRRTKGLEEVNTNPNDWKFEFADFSLKKPFRFTKLSSLNEKSLAENSFYQAEAKCPFGKVGDILWVRETTCWIMLDHAHDLLEGAKDRTQFVYKANIHYDWMEYAREKYGYKWKPSIYMQKEACRLFLQIKSITVERLNDISESDAIAEGVKMTWISDNPKLCMFKNYIQDGRGSLSAKDSFHSLWLSINGPTSWVKNPWVWVIEFKKIEKPENFI